MTTATAIGQGASVWIVLPIVVLFAVAVVLIVLGGLTYLLASRSDRHRRRARNAFDPEFRAFLRRGLESKGMHHDTEEPHDTYRERGSGAIR